MWVLLIPVILFGVWRLTRSNPTIWVIGDSQACGATSALSPCGSIRPITPDCAKSGETYSSEVKISGRTLMVDCEIGSHTNEWTYDRLTALGVSRGDTLVVFLGSNDYNSFPSLDTILSFVDENQLSLIWVGPPKLFGKEGKIVPYLMNALQDKYFDSRVLNLKLGDGVHPTPGEFERWINAVLSLL